uniref:Uncharacterized protein n=1 Tax=Anopheles merus TaxID=30066 RepID=A0A182UWP9_ANOME
MANHYAGDEDDDDDESRYWHKHTHAAIRGGLFGEEGGSHSLGSFCTGPYSSAGTFVKSTAVLASIPMLADLAVRWQQPFSIPPHVPCSKPPDIQQSRKNSHVPPSCWHCLK